MKSNNALQTVLDATSVLSPIVVLADIPEEDIWLAKQKTNASTRLLTIGNVLLRE